MIDIEGNKVLVALRGKCSFCPSSEVTLKQYVELKLREFVSDDIEVEERLVEGIRVPVATARMLYRMKKDTVRLQDRADAEGGQADLRAGRVAQAQGSGSQPRPGAAFQAQREALTQ